MRVYWMKVHMRFCECACLRGGCVWRQSVWVWVHSCRDDVTSWKLIHSAYRWGHWFLELGSGSLNEGFPAVMATAQLLWGFTVSLCVCLCVCAGVWGGAVQTQPISKATALRHVYQCLPLLFCMRIPWCHFSFRHRGSQVTPPLCHSVNTHTLSRAQTRFSNYQLKNWTACQCICLTWSESNGTEDETHACTERRR